MATGALAVISILTTLGAGFMQKKEADKEARAIKEQQEIKRIEDENAANMAVDQNRKFLAQQKLQFLLNGVNLEGSPLLVLEDTANFGIEEVQAFKNRSNAQMRLMGKQASRVKNAGRASLIGSGIKATEIGVGAFSDPAKETDVFGVKETSEVKSPVVSGTKRPPRAHFKGGRAIPGPG